MAKREAAGSDQVYHFGTSLMLFFLDSDRTRP